MGKIVAHDFKKKHFNRPTWCNFCQKFVWGIGYQGFQCIGKLFPLILHFYFQFLFIPPQIFTNKHQIHRNPHKNNYKMNKKTQKKHKKTHKTTKSVQNSLSSKMLCINRAKLSR